MKLRVVNNLERCRFYWNKFSPQENLFDLWEYRFCFYKGYGYEPHFIVGEEEGEAVGVLPLWYEKKNSFYTFFGGLFPEPNSFWIKDKEKVKEFLDFCPHPTNLYYILSPEDNSGRLVKDEKNYYLDLKKLGGEIERLFSAFSKKHRKNLRYDLRKLEKRGYEVKDNQLADFEKMVNFNQNRFKENSDFNEPEMVLSMKELAKTAALQQRLNLISLEIEGKTGAVELGVEYNRCYYVLGGGRDLEIENIGKLMVREQIKRAMAKGLEKIDFLSTDSGWKSQWHLETKDYLRYSTQSDFRVRENSGSLSFDGFAGEKSFIQY